MRSPGSTPRVRLDHFVVGVDDLERGRDDFEARTGVRPAPGGEHPALGTHNALVALGDRAYLEILAPRAGATVHPAFREVATFDQLTPFRWALATDDVRGVREVLRGAGVPVGPLVPGARRMEDGGLLEWTMLFAGPGAPDGAPFFLEWSPASVHPSETAPGGCGLEGYAVSSADPAGLRELLGLLGLRAEVTGPGEPSRIDLATPGGRVRIR